ncbi:hypothetical protein D929_01911 [Enterococcus faecalis 02-MB-P-10]|nr:hypothetical protein D929_01911 [Enterococcus faecalis 02-MB-P-10]
MIGNQVYSIEKIKTCVCTTILVKLLMDKEKILFLGFRALHYQLETRKS